MKCTYPQREIALEPRADSRSGREVNFTGEIGINESFVLAIEDQTLPRVTPLSVLSRSRGREEERPWERGNQKDLWYYSLVPFRVLHACALVCGVPSRSQSCSQSPRYPYPAERETRTCPRFALSRSLPFSFIRSGTKYGHVGKGEGNRRKRGGTEGSNWGVNQLKSGKKWKER